MNITLYKKDTKGKIRYLRIETSNDLLTQSSGILWWAEVKASRHCLPKNIGRSNETTANEQAELEAEAIVTDKLTKGYFKTKEEADGWSVILPMLAKDYFKEKDKIDWSTAYLQPKLDWMRCLAFIKDGNVKLMSRQGKEITTCPHIVKALIWMDDIILDWELYAHGFTFQENMSMVKKFIKWQTDRHIVYNIYDVVDTTKSFIDRFYPLYSNKIITTSPSLAIVSTSEASEDTIEELSSMDVEQWYEGSIVRWSNDWYKVGWRSANLLKLKQFLDTTATIIDVEPMDARPTQWVLVCRLQEGSSELFRASLKFSFKEREYILRNKNLYIWQTAEIRYFEDTDDWLPRFPVCVWFRLDK